MGHLGDKSSYAYPFSESSKMEESSYGTSSGVGGHLSCTRQRSHQSIIIFNCTLFAFGSLSATFLILTLFTRRQLRSTPYAFLNVLIFSFVCRMFLNGTVYTEESFDLCWRIGRPTCVFLNLAEPLTVYSVVVFLIVVAWEQSRRYGTASERAAVVRSKGLQVSILYFLVLLLSTPDIINALSEHHRPEAPILHCDINNFYPSQKMHQILAGKRCFLEYLMPLIVLYALVALIVIRMIRSRVTVPAQTTAYTQAPNRPPRFFAMLAAVIVAYTVGYFPRYFHMLAIVVIRTFDMEVRNSHFLDHLQTVERMFALIPPSFFPLFVLTLSRSHLEAGKEIFYRIRVRLSGRGWSSDGMIQTNGEDEALNIGMDQLRD